MTTFVLRGVALGLAWFVLLNLVASAGIARVAGVLAGADGSRSATYWFALRILPAAMAIGFVTAVFAPSYWMYEPREYGEAFDVSLLMLALAAGAVIVAAALRGLAAWWQASRRVREWMRLAGPMSVPGSMMPAYVIDVDAPLMALAGIWRPRLLVARRLVDALTPEELAASVAHEAGHQRARDNLKRLVMRAAPDFLPATAAARTIERRWASAAEHTADRLAGRDCTDTRCALASALVKVARLTPLPAVLGEPISTFVGGGEIVSRVERLLDDRAAASPPGRAPRFWVLTAAVIVAAGVGYTPLLRAVHAATEVLVHTLP